MLFLNIFLLGATFLSTGVSAAGKLAQTSFTNNVRFLFDVDGNQIDAYGSKINFFNGKYYLYGNSFAITGVAFGVKSYSSNDLVYWAYEGFLYDPYSANPCNQDGGCGRPHILFNEKSQTYVLWTNAGPNGYNVATSSSPSTGFVFAPSKALIDPRFAALQPADFAVESFGSQAYIVFSALNFEFPQAGSIWPPIQQTLHISPLTSDFMSTTRASYNVSSQSHDLIDQEAESPDLFMRNGTFYVAASNTCGYCNGSIGLIYRSDSIKGPWTRQIISGYSCDGQVEGVLPLTDPTNGQTSYIWHSTSVPGGPRVGFSGHIFQPLQFQANGGVEDLKCSSNANFPVRFNAGNGDTPSGIASTASDGSPAIANYHSVCDSDQFTLFQTWKASKSGTLTQVSINIAKSVQTVPLVINVFKLSNANDFLSPEYKYMLLGTSIVNQTELSFVFDTTSVSLNAKVSAGDNLGFSIAGSDFAPYCHLEYDLDFNDQVCASAQVLSPVLWQQGAGQNSWRGLQGHTSPVYKRDGKGIKFFVTVV